MDTRTVMRESNNIPDVQISLDLHTIIMKTRTQHSTRMPDPPPHHRNRDPTIHPQLEPCPNPRNLTLPTTDQSVVHKTTPEELTLHHTTKVIRTTHSLDLHPSRSLPPHTIPHEHFLLQQVFFEPPLHLVMAPL